MNAMCDDCKGNCETCRFMRTVTTWLDVGKAFFELRQRVRELRNSGNFTPEKRAEACMMLDGLKLQIQEDFDGQG